MVHRDDAGEPRFCPFRQTHRHHLLTFCGLACQLQDDYGKKIFKSIEITLVSITILCQNVARLTFCMWVVVRRSVRSVFGPNTQNGVAHPNVRPNAILTLCLSLPSGAQLPSQIGLDAALAIIAKGRGCAQAARRGAHYALLCSHGSHPHTRRRVVAQDPAMLLRESLGISAVRETTTKTRPMCTARDATHRAVANKRLRTAPKRPSRFARWRPCSREKGRLSPLTDADRTRTLNTFS